MKLLVFLITLSLPLFSAAGKYGDCKAVNDQATQLKIIETEIEVLGKSSKVYEIVHNDGSKVIEKTKGECFNLVVDNQTSVPTTLHWHGLVLPVLEDGVAFVTQAPIPPGTKYPYNFEIVQAGTYYMHSHYGVQEQRLMVAPLILVEKEKSPYRSIVILFEDFSFTSPKDIWLGLRKNFMEKVKTEGKNWLPNLLVPKKKYAPNDLNDVQYDTYLTNRKTLITPQIETVSPGETVRLRFINGSASSAFLVKLGALKGTIIAVDGHPTEPIDFDEFPIATSQRVDALVTLPKEGGAFPILAQAQGTHMRTGLILKTAETKTPNLPLTTTASIGAISNHFEKELRAKNPLKPRKVDRVLKAELGGNMKYYTWAINGHVWPNDQPLFVKEGERVELEFINKTNMSHPMHLHGHFFQVVEINGVRFEGAIRDTILVMPFETVKVIFDANNPGVWAMHCHILYHLWGGMFTVIQYEGYTPPKFTKQQILDYSRVYGGY